EQLVGHVDAGFGKPVHQRRLAGIRIADQCDHRIRNRLPLAAVELAGAVDFLEPILELVDAVAHLAAVGLELGFAGPARTDAGLHARKMRPRPRKARQHVLELRELDLQLAGTGLRAKREDVEDELAAVEHLDRQRAGRQVFRKRLLEVAALRRRQRIVEDHDFRVLVGDDALELLDLAASDARRGRQLLHLLADAVDYVEPGRFGKKRELLQRFGGVRGIVPGPHEDRALPYDACLVFHRASLCGSSSTPRSVTEPSPSSESAAWISPSVGSIASSAASSISVSATPLRTICRYERHFPG